MPVKTTPGQLAACRTGCRQHSRSPSTSAATKRPCGARTRAASSRRNGSACAVAVFTRQTCSTGSSAARRGARRRTSEAESRSGAADGRHPDRDRRGQRRDRRARLAPSRATGLTAGGRSAGIGPRRERGRGHGVWRGRPDRLRGSRAASGRRRPRRPRLPAPHDRTGAPTRTTTRPNRPLVQDKAWQGLVSGRRSPGSSRRCTRGSRTGPGSLRAGRRRRLRRRGWSNLQLHRATRVRLCCHDVREEQMIVLARDALRTCDRIRRP